MYNFSFQNNDLNPVWNEHFQFVVEDPLTQNLVVKIYDDEGLQSSELIGCGRVSLNELELCKVKNVWLDLVKDLELQRDQKYRGQVRTISSFSFMDLMPVLFCFNQVKFHIFS